MTPEFENVPKPRPRKAKKTRAEILKEAAEQAEAERIRFIQEELGAPLELCRLVASRIRIFRQANQRGVKKLRKKLIRSGIYACAKASVDLLCLKANEDRLETADKVDFLAERLYLMEELKAALKEEKARKT